ncbi:hypothetical protein [Pinibacter soli]|uniref:Uncharacterized protein n=1 Tax=Pinibacter soli TaxID=3044211 RepID=A0ABT6R768_9BACT|nr:hypothetical protein [Pinibacter soli]MDI3318414.1 hypothetical protein [Pinibacter soli]
MEFCPIFETENELECRLWAVIYPEHEIDIFDACYRNWSNEEFIRSFVNERFDSLDSIFFKDATVSNIISTIKLEVVKFAVELLNANEEIEGCKSLDQLFKRLYGNVESLHFDHDDERKARPSIQGSILRLYAILLDDGTYLVTGGTIKLYKAMIGPEFKVEFDNVKRVKVFLKAHGIADVQGLIDK